MKSAAVKETVLEETGAAVTDLDGVDESVLGVTLRHRQETVSHVRWHWVEAGFDRSAGSRHPQFQPAETIVLIHGYPESWFAWRHQLAAFAGRYRLIALDLKGFGHSRGFESRASSYHPLRVAEDVLLLLDRIEVHRFNLVAHSLGSIVGDYLAGVEPHRVLRYARIQAASEMSDQPALWQREALGNYRQAVRRHRAPHLVRSIYDRSCRLEIAEADVERMEADFHLPGVAEAVSSYSDARWPLPSWRAERRDRFELFARMEMPVVLIQGDSVPGQPVSDYGQTAAFLPRGRVEVIPDCGAFAHGERPKPVNKALSTLFETPVAALSASERVTDLSVRRDPILGTGPGPGRRRFVSATARPGQDR
ncbi:MAG: alpha/beta fold hydrolase [Acidobacteriota bacterium]